MDRMCWLTLGDEDIGARGINNMTIDAQGGRRDNRLKTFSLSGHWKSMDQLRAHQFIRSALRPAQTINLHDRVTDLDRAPYSAGGNKIGELDLIDTPAMGGGLSPARKEVSISPTAKRGYEDRMHDNDHEHKQSLRMLSPRAGRRSILNRGRPGDKDIQVYLTRGREGRSLNRDYGNFTLARDPSNEYDNDYSTVKQSLSVYDR